MKVQQEMAKTVYLSELPQQPPEKKGRTSPAEEDTSTTSAQGEWVGAGRGLGKGRSQSHGACGGGGRGGQQHSSARAVARQHTPALVGCLRGLRGAWRHQHHHLLLLPPLVPCPACTSSVTGPHPLVTLPACLSLPLLPWQAGSTSLGEAGSAAPPPPLQQQPLPFAPVPPSSVAAAGGGGVPDGGGRLADYFKYTEKRNRLTPEDDHRMRQFFELGNQGARRQTDRQAGRQGKGHRQGVGLSVCSYLSVCGGSAARPEPARGAHQDQRGDGGT